MNTLTLDPPVPFIVPTHQPIDVALVGCGGTGSHLAHSLARLAYHMRERGGPSLTLTLIDGDMVSRSNVGRQLFGPRDVGKPKAQVLADRLNATLGLAICAIPDMATTPLLAEIAPRSDKLGILVGAVDTTTGRQALHAALERQPWRLWLECGNEHDWGTVVIGSVTDSAQLRGAFALGGVCTALPAATLCYPHLLTAPPALPAADCAAAMQAGSQSLLVNQLIAGVASQYLAQLAIQRQITSFTTAIDLATLTMRSQPITATAVAAATGVPVATLCARPESRGYQGARR